MKFDGSAHIKHLEFDLTQRILTIFHESGLDQIESALAELKLGHTMLSSDSTEQTAFDNNKAQKSVLWSVLMINLFFFILEMTFGIVSRSMGLVADSLDMLADSFVYALSLMAVGKSLFHKKTVAKIAGYFQILLALIGFAEVIRRTLFGQEFPDYSTMIIVSLGALIGNGWCLYLLQRSKDSDQAHMKASLIFTSNDIIINLGVILAGLLVYWLGSNIPDLLIGALVFIIVTKGALRILSLGKN